MVMLLLLAKGLSVFFLSSMVQLEVWFKSRVPTSVFSAGGGRGSVEAWYATALDIEEVLTGAADSHVHLFVADVIKSFDTCSASVLGVWTNCTHFLRCGRLES